MSLMFAADSFEKLIELRSRTGQLCVRQIQSVLLGMELHIIVILVYSRTTFAQSVSFMFVES